MIANYPELQELIAGGPRVHQPKSRFKVLYETVNHPDPNMGRWSLEYLKHLLLFRHLRDLSDTSPDIDSTSSSSEKGEEPSKMKRSGEHRCDCCGRTYSCPGNLTRHLKKECNKLPGYICLCGKAYVHKHSLKDHIKRHHNSTLEEFWQKGE